MKLQTVQTWVINVTLNQVLTNYQIIIIFWKRNYIGFFPYFFWKTNITGDVIQVQYDSGTDDTPVNSNGYNYNLFSGFRVAPE